MLGRTTAIGLRGVAHLLRSRISSVGACYYWFSSGLVGWNSSATRFATATNLAGPWSDLQLLRTDPLSEDSFNAQHEFIIPVARTEATKWVYAGDRYSQWIKVGTGRNVILPLVWENDLPALLWYREWKVEVTTGRSSTIATP